MGRVMPAENLDDGIDLRGAVALASGVEAGSCPHCEGETTVAGDGPTDLPSADNRGRGAFIEHGVPLAERQVIHPVNAERLLAVDAGQSLVERVRQRVGAPHGAIVVVALVIVDGLGERVTGAEYGGADTFPNGGLQSLISRG